ncbi:MAG: dihydrofolate reductase family protein [Dysgonomonas sp.]|nr:dihydrofolate reductase family protein [Dysgonomonas sp.]
MRKIILYIASSLDGYIARKDGSIDWLTDYPILEDFDYGYSEFYNSIGTIIMGGNSYRDALKMSDEWLYPEKISYVITNRPEDDQENIRFISSNVVDFISGLKQREGKDIWLFGGGQIISLLLNNSLVDEMIITYIPVILGNGIPLFSNNLKESGWNLMKSEAYANSTYQVMYAKK